MNLCEYGCESQEAKVSLESRHLANLTEHDVNDPTSTHFIRFMAAKQETDAARVYMQDHVASTIEVFLRIFLYLFLFIFDY